MLDHPLLLNPNMVPRVWGGARISQRFSRSSFSEPIGESWEIHGELVVAEGPLAGRTLNQLVEEFGDALLGSRMAGHGDFPLLTKWLDCHDWLSVQVHPDDRLAREFTGDPKARGKSEAWFVVESAADSKLIHGLRPGVHRQAFADELHGEVLELLAEHTPKVGELLFTPAGTIHALGPGALIYEVQQSSDLTYRFFDWGRDRPIHPRKAARCAAEASSPPHLQSGNQRVRCPYFEIEVVTESRELDLNGESFQIIASVGQGATLEGEFGVTTLPSGASSLLPATMGGVSLNPLGAVLVIDVPEEVL